MELPRLISVDDHVVEPPHVWERWLPAALPRPRARRSCAAASASIDYVGTASYVEHFDDDSPTKVDCWIYEDLVYTHKRMVAAVGYPKEEMTLTPITYDDMRPGCYDPKARLDDMDVGWVEASMCFPTLPRFCGQTFLEGHDKELGLACVQAYNDWMVEEWCGDSGGRLIPLGDHPAVGRRPRRRRGAAQRGPRRPRRLLQRAAVPPRPAHHPHRVLGSVLRRVRRDRAPSSRCTSVRRRRCRRPHPTRRRR